MRISLKFFRVALLCLCGFAVFLNSELYAQKNPNFEGTVLFKKQGYTNGRVDSASTLLSIKGEKFLAEDAKDKNQPKIVVDARKKSVLMIVDRDKNFMEMPLPPSAGGNAVVKPPTRTGKSETIAGHKCDQWIEKDDNVDMELWTSGDLGKIALPGGSMGVDLISSMNMANFLKNSNLFPFLFIERKNGKEVTRLEVLNVDKKTIADATFQVPIGYAKMTVPGSPPQPKKK